MTDDETDEETPDGADEEQPDISEEEMADPADIAAEVEQETKEQTDEEETSDEEQDDTEDDEQLDLGAGTETWGDMYVGTLTTVSNALIDEYGVEGAEPVDEDLARQLDLDEHFNRWMETHDRTEMPPEQAVLFGTLVFLGSVTATKTDLPDRLLSEVNL